MVGPGHLVGLYSNDRNCHNSRVPNVTKNFFTVDIFLGTFEEVKTFYTSRILREFLQTVLRI